MVTLDLDPQTLLVVKILVTLLTAGGSFLIWFQDRTQTAVFWVAISGVVTCIAVIGRAALPLGMLMRSRTTMTCMDTLLATAVSKNWRMPL